MKTDEGTGGKDRWSITLVKCHRAHPGRSNMQNSYLIGLISKLR